MSSASTKSLLHTLAHSFWIEPLTTMRESYLGVVFLLKLSHEAMNNQTSLPCALLLDGSYSHFDVHVVKNLVWAM